jgi:nicotinate-nucleotide adenylyltransferase
MRVGLLGGTFDPIHLGHLRAAENAREELGLDSVRFLPAGRPPHKRRELSSADDRYAMVALATAHQPAFVPDGLELHRDGPSYTADTLTALREARAGDELFLIVGSDTALEMATWRDPDRVFALCTVAVVARPGCAGELPPGRKAVRVAGPGLSISSSEIRERVAQGKSVRYLVADAVADYITKRRLFT